MHCDFNRGGYAWRSNANSNVRQVRENDETEAREVGSVTPFLSKWKLISSPEYDQEPKLIRH